MPDSRTAIDRLLGEWSGLAGIPDLSAAAVTPLPGGTARRSFRVQVPGFDAVLRLARPGSAPSLLAEAEAVRAAAAVRAGPPLLAESPAGLLIAHQPGSALTPADLRNADVRRRLGQALGRLHRAEAPATRLDLSGLVRAYRQELQQAGTPEPAQYREVLEGLAAIERVLLATATPAVAAHGDAVVDNFVDDGSCVHVIDLEYAVRAEPWFDLATLLDSAADTDAGDEPAVDLAAALVTDYIAAVPSPYSVDLLAARVRAWRLLARAAWWPWAMLPAQRANPRAERWRDLHALSAMVAAEAKVLPEALVP